MKPRVWGDSYAVYKFHKYLTAAAADRTESDLYIRERQWLKDSSTVTASYTHLTHTVIIYFFLALYGSCIFGRLG